MTSLAVITSGMDPTIEVGPITLAWHGITIAIGIVVGSVVARHEARRRGLEIQPLEAMIALLALGAIVGARVFYLAEHGEMFEPREWLSTTGFTFYGGFIGAGLGIGAYLWRRRLPMSYLDAIAVGVPLGIAVGSDRRRDQRRALRTGDELLPRRAQHTSGSAHAKP